LFFRDEVTGKRQRRQHAPQAIRWQCRNRDYGIMESSEVDLAPFPGRKEFMPPLIEDFFIEEQIQTAKGDKKKGATERQPGPSQSCP
jgi:hypothetical protein